MSADALAQALQWEVMTPREFLAFNKTQGSRIEETKFIPPHRTKGKRYRTMVLVRRKY
jgi:hypothetical protein